jgi:acyl dehydratase
MSASDFLKNAKPGDALPPLTKPPIDRVQLVKYAGASGDFNRIHFEEEFARAGGYPSVIAHGMLSMAFLGQLLSDLAGPQAVRRLKARFKAVTYPGDVVTCRGEVTGVREERGERLVDLKLWAEKQDGSTTVITVEGSATIAIPI